MNEYETVAIVILATFILTALFSKELKTFIDWIKGI